MSFDANKIVSYLVICIVFFGCKKDTIDKTSTIQTLNGATINQEIVGKWKLDRIRMVGITHNNCEYAIDTYYNAIDQNIDVEFEIIPEGWLFYREGDSLERVYKISSGSGNNYKINGTEIYLIQLTSIFDAINVGDTVDFLGFFYERHNSFDNNITLIFGRGNYIKIE